jgi:hypothetical protein
MYKAKDGNYEYNDAAKYNNRPTTCGDSHSRHEIIEIIKKIIIVHANHTGRIHTVETISLPCWKVKSERLHTKSLCKNMNE